MYSNLIVDHFTDPSFVGDLDECDLAFEIGNSVCGDRIRIQLSLDAGIIAKVVFRAWGCATSIATADIFCESIRGKTSADITLRSHEEIEAMLGELDPSQHHCVHILQELHNKVVEEMGATV